jgi:hypothetical protein
MKPCLCPDVIKDVLAHRCYVGSSVTEWVAPGRNSHREKFRLSVLNVTDEENPHPQSSPPRKIRP